MKLLDQVVQAASAIDIEDGTGRYLLPGAGQFSTTIDACQTRFIVDANVESYCRSLLRTERGMLIPRNEFLRLPTSAFWLEWPCEPSADAMSGSRSGVLVEACDRGRSGRLTTFWEQKTGEPVVAQMIAGFDLDDEAMAADAPGGTWALRPGSHPLAANLTFAVAPGWQRHMDSLPPAAARSAAGQIIANVLPGLEFAFAFSALLAERTCLNKRDVDLTRLNRQRRRKGKPPLLDHIEVRLELSTGQSAQAWETSGDREPARLHTVRGHMVNRLGRTFWRRSHLRGEPSRSGWTRTVHVTRKTG